MELPNKQFGIGAFAATLPDPLGPSRLTHLAGKSRYLPSTPLRTIASDVIAPSMASIANSVTRACFAVGAPVACASTPLPGPYVGGRLVDTAYIEIAGAPDEIVAIKAYAAKQGWAEDCEGRAGKQATLRLRFPPGTTQNAIEDYFADILNPHGTRNQMVYAGMDKSRGCVALP